MGDINQTTYCGTNLNSHTQLQDTTTGVWEPRPQLCKVRIPRLSSGRGSPLFRHSAVPWRHSPATLGTSDPGDHNNILDKTREMKLPTLPRLLLYTQLCVKFQKASLQISKYVPTALTKAGRVTWGF